MRSIKCQYCGRVYESPSVMRTKKCHSHPKGAWCGYCTPDRVDEFQWGIEKRSEENRKREHEGMLLDAKFSHEYKKHTPLLDCVLKRDAFEDGPSSFHLQIRNSDLNDLAVQVANGINSKTRDAINTIYALRDGCDFVLNNAEAQKEGSLGTWLDEVKRLKDEVVSWDFWVSLYWLTKSIKDQAGTVGFEDWENNREKWNYWNVNSIAKLFQMRHVIPMLHAVNKKGDEKEIDVMNAIRNRVQKLRSEKSIQKDFDPGQMRCIETLCRRIDEYAYWGLLYSLYWIELRPTPWNDQKVWPISVPQDKAKNTKAEGCW